MIDKTHSNFILHFCELGAILGFMEALLYGFIYTLVGIFYTSVNVLKNLQTDILPTVLANAVSVLIGAMFFAVFFGFIAAVFQGLAFGLVGFTTAKVKSGNLTVKSAWIGFGISVIFAALIHLLVITSPPIVIQVFWNLSYIFWLGIPCLIFIATTTFFSRKISIPSF